MSIGPSPGVVFGRFWPKKFQQTPCRSLARWLRKVFGLAIRGSDPPEVSGGRVLGNSLWSTPNGHGDPHLRGRCVGIFNGEFRGGFFCFLEIKGEATWLAQKSMNLGPGWRVKIDSLRIRTKSKLMSFQWLSFHESSCEHKSCEHLTETITSKI